LERKPPKSIQELLRKEVNFGCPVQGCGVPYFTWHHFDPPWSEKKHHNPEGMIALCSTHADLADGGRWTKEQLRKMKKNPFLSHEQISDKFDYLRKNVVCIIGNVAFSVKNVLEINNERVIGFEKDKENFDRLNLLIRDINGNPILVMEDNFWTVLSRELFDLRCSAYGKELEIVSKDRQTNFFMRFDDYPLKIFRDRLLSYYRKTTSKLPDWLNEEFKAMLRERTNSDTSFIDNFIHEIGSPKIVPTWTVKGKLRYGNIHLDIRDFEIEELMRDNIFGMNLMIGGKTAFSFSNTSMSMGVT